MKKEEIVEGESSNSLRPEAVLRKKQTARRSIKIYGEFDETLRLPSFKEELQRWREAVQHDQLVKARGEEIESIGPIAPQFLPKSLRTKAPSVFIELSKEKRQ